MRTQADEPTGCASANIAAWAADARQAAAHGGDVFTFFISGAKEKNPQAAQAMAVALR